jgi:hypothetical protein
MGVWLSKIVISQAEVTIVAEITLSELKLSPENDNIFSFIKNLKLVFFLSFKMFVERGV